MRTMKKMISVFLTVVVLTSCGGAGGAAGSVGSQAPAESAASSQSQSAQSAEQQGDEGGQSAEQQGNESAQSEASAQQPAEDSAQSQPPAEESGSDLLSQIEAQEVRITATRYVVQSDEYKALYPDMLQAVITNDSDRDIKDAVVAFVAWDENGLPVNIKGQFDFTNGSYVKKVNYAGINLIPGKSFGENQGFSLEENNKIETFLAIVVSYEDFDGNTWENPLFSEWCRRYEGVRYPD